MMIMMGGVGGEGERGGKTPCGCTAAPAPAPAPCTAACPDLGLRVQAASDHFR